MKQKKDADGPEFIKNIESETGEHVKVKFFIQKPQ